jgi:hypothetical protein
MICIICSGEPCSPIVLVAKPKRIKCPYIIFDISNKIINKYFVLGRTDFTIVSNGEHGSPLQYSNNFVTFI